MNVGTKSLLFGVHQFIWHPITVLIAWVSLYGRPTWRELVCIIIHDWGYWGAPNMDGAEGERHPELGAKLAHWLFDGYVGPVKSYKYRNLVLLHSRHHARALGVEPSKLWWADILSILYEPWWLYLPRAWASGELREYRNIAADTGFIPLSTSHRRWYVWLQDRLATLGREKRGEAVPYMNPERENV
jgi:hypothetical protein